MNLGRNGFGSSRVAIVFEQALEVLEPDLAVVYSGHNEFIEMGFRMDLDAQWPNPFVRSAADFLVATNLFHFVTSLDPEERTTQADPTPKAWKWEYEKFRDLDLEQTKIYLNGYRKNLEQIVEVAEREGVKLALSSVVYNRFAMPSSSVLSKGTSTVIVEAVERKERELFDSVPAWLRPLVPEQGWERVENFDWDRGWREAGSDSTLEFLDWGTAWDTRLATGRLQNADPLIPAQAYWNPKVTRLVACLEQLHRGELSDQERQELLHTQSLAEEILAQCSDHPVAHFALGLCSYALGRVGEAKKHLELAGDFDRAPRRGSRAINAIIEGVAQESRAVLFVDADLAFSECEPMGLVGWKWMLDQCHLGFGGRRYTMMLVAEQVAVHWQGEW